jgi:ParB family transcriptional regulator, chromosome partitioning protein
MRDVLNLSIPATGYHEVEIAAITVPERLRIVDRAYVESIRATFAEVGLMQPISLAPAPSGNGLILVDGEHRYEAVKLAGWATIKAVIREMTAQEREKHEIYANLIRNELNALDRIVFVGRLAEIFAAEHPEARHGGDRKTKNWLKKNQLENLANWSAFNGEAARRTGLGEKSVRNARALYDALGPAAIARLRGSPLADNAAQLKALAEQPEEKRGEILGLLAEGRAANVRRAREIVGLDLRREPEAAAQEAFMGAMMRLELPQLRSRLAILQEVIALKSASSDAKKAGKAAKAGAGA